MFTRRLIILLIALSLYAQENIAVLELDADGVTPSEAKTLTNKLRGELIKTGMFTVIERGQMDNILKEQGFQSSGACNDQACIVEVGQLLGVENMVAGSIGKVGSIYLISLRMIDVAKGNILKNIDEEVEGEISDVLRTGLTNAARKMAGLEVEAAVPRSQPQAQPEPQPVIEPVSPPVFGLKRSRIAVADASTQDQERQKRRDAVASKQQRLFSLSIGQNSLNPNTLIWYQKDSFNLTYKDIEWESGLHTGIRFSMANIYGKSRESSFFFGCGDLGLFFENNKSASGTLDVVDSLSGFTFPVKITDKSLSLTKFTIYDNITMGYRILSRPVAFEPYAGISLACEFGTLNGELVKDLSLLKLVPRLGFPFGTRVFFGKFFIAFEYNKFFKAFHTAIDPNYDANSPNLIEGDFSFEGVSYWAVQFGVVAGKATYEYPEPAK